MSAIGTKRPIKDVRAMSAIEAISEVKYSLRVFRMLTHLCHPTINFAVMHNAGASRILAPSEHRRDNEVTARIKACDAIGMCGQCEPLASSA
jgi:hypothetical protein